MDGAPSLHARDDLARSRPAVPATGGRRRDALAEINTASECLLFLLTAMFGADAPCRRPGGPCPKIADVMTFLRRRFAREEEQMRDALYPREAEHVAEHQAVLARLDAMHHHFRCGHYDPVTVLDFLENWAIGHIEHHDKPLGHFLVEREAADGLDAA